MVRDVDLDVYIASLFPSIITEGKEIFKKTGVSYKKKNLIIVTGAGSIIF